MYLNKRMMPKKLMYYNALGVRSELTPNEAYNMKILLKGYEGECLYDKIFDEISHDNIYIMRDIYLNAGGTVAQYDSIIITENRIVMNEIKNTPGDYRFEDNKWFKNSRELTNNVYAQLSRAKGKLMKLRDDYHLNFEIEGDLVFVNDDFRLSTENVYIWEVTVLRNQLRNYFRQFRNEKLGNNANNIVKAIKNQIVDDPYFNESADIFKIRRGLYCGQCNSFNLNKGRFQLTCSHCGTIESNETHLFRAMNDYQILFQNEPMTRYSLLYFVDNQIGKTSAYEIMKKHCDIIKKGNNSEYELKNKNFREVLQQIRKTQRYKDKIIKNNYLFPSEL